MSHSSAKKDIYTDYSFYELTSESIAVYEEGKILHCNSNFIKSFGYSSFEGISGLSLFHFFPKIYREILSVSEADVEKKFETLCVRNDSSTFPAEVVVKVVKKQNQVIKAVVVRDETERKGLENESIKSTIFQRAILNSTSFAIITTDFTGLIKTFNSGAEKMFGYDAADIVDQKNLTYLFCKKDIRNKARLLETQLDKKAGTDFEVFVGKLQLCQVDEQEWVGVRKNESKIISSVNATTLIDNLNEINGYLFTCIDITDRKKAEEEITQKSQLLSGIARNMPVFIFKVDENGSFVQAFGSVLDKFGYKEEHILGLNIYEVFPKVKKIIDKAYKGDFVSFVDSRKINGKEGHYEHYIFPDLSTNEGIIGFALDISENKIYERKLKESTLHLEKINKELDQFAYIVSHDLKAPLRAISNLSLWIEEDIGDNIDEDSKNNLALMRDRVKRMQSLIDGILSYSRIGRIKAAREEVNLKDLLMDVKEAIAVPDAFIIKMPENLPLVHINRTWLEQVFTNLLSNAIKYHDKKEGNIEIGYIDDSENHIFSVIDDGPGIAPEYHEKIFMIFQTLESKDKIDSTGIGLSIVKKIVEEHGGKIWVESDGHSGTKFSFTIPMGNNNKGKI